MSDTPNAAPTNEFGTTLVQGMPADQLNQQGASPTLADILAEIQKKHPVPDASTPAVPTVPNAQTPAVEEAADPLKPATTEAINTGNKALDVAVSSFIRSTGANDADLQRAIKSAMEYGDPNLIDDAFLAERFKDRAGEARQIAEAVLEQTGIERSRLVESVYAQAGDKAKWDASLAVYKQHAAPGLQKAIQMMFDSGDATSIKEAAALVVDYAKSSGVLSVTGGRVTAGTGEAGAEGISASELQQAVGKLNQSSRTYREDYAKLIGLRQLGRSLGK